MDSGKVEKLRRFVGAKLELCWCEFVPALSSPYDLYSLSVLGARCLLSHRNNSLATVVDALENLGRVAGRELAPGATFRQTHSVIDRLLSQGDAENSLALRHVFGETPGVPTDSDWLPPQIWSEAISILIRLIPGLGPTSLCADYGAAPDGGLHIPLEEPLAALEDLNARVRSLIFSDWNSNLEARMILSDLRAQL